MEWKTVKLGDCLSKIIDNRGKTPKDLVPSGHPLLEINAVSKNNKYPLYGEAKKYVDDVVYSTWFRSGHPQYGDILVPTVGTLGAVAYVGRNDCCIAQNLIALRANTDICDSAYIYYVLCNPQIVKRLLNLDIGAVQASIKVPHLLALEIPLPPLETQRRIAAILSSLDDKIENNNRINRNLEAQAQALFKSWFVDFEPFGGTMPEDWKEGSLNEMTSKFGTGLNPRKNFKLGEGENYYVTIKNMGNNRVYLDDKCDKVTDEAIEKINKRSKLQAGDLLFSGIGTIGRVALVTETPTNWNTSESVFNLHPANNISSEFLYILLLSDVFQNYVKVHAQGGVQQGIRMASLKDYKMYIPEDSKMKQFDSLIIPIITRIKNIDKENDRLAALRDTLLPKLMKGEIEV